MNDEPQGTCAVASPETTTLNLHSLFEAMLREKQERIVHCGPVTIEFTELACELVWYRRPRSKKRRTREKWRRNIRNWKKIPAWYEERPGHVYAHPYLRPMLEVMFASHTP